MTLKKLLYDLKTTNQSEKMTTGAGKVETITLLCSMSLMIN